MEKTRLLKPSYARTMRTIRHQQMEVRQAKSKRTRRVSALLAESRPDSEGGAETQKVAPRQLSAPMRVFGFWGQRPARQGCKPDSLGHSNEVREQGSQACLTCAGELTEACGFRRKRSVKRALPLVQWSVQRNEAISGTCNKTGNQI